MTIQEQLAAARGRGAPIRLRKSTSNLFRRRRAGALTIDARRLNHVLKVEGDTAEVEGMTTYATLVDAALALGRLPAVAPQLKTITVGGAVSGLGIESSSFRFGLVHETVEEMDVLLGDGRVVTCSPEEKADLFRGFPNSYGTLGYALRLKVRLIPAAPFVRLTHTRFTDPGAYFSAIEGASAVDYLDGAIFSRGEMYLTTGEFASSAPFTSNYRWLRMYYRSIRERTTDYLTARDYIWRWDTDWFWCSKHFGAQHAVVRLLAGPWLLNSRTYQRLMRLGQRLLPEGGVTEPVIQDVDIPVGRAAEFLDFLLDRVGITPIWMCPFRSRAPCDLYALDPGTLYINFGFWDAVKAGPEPGFYNRLIERKADELGGRKGLYSTAWYDEATFWRIYNKPRYDELKRKYDPEGVFADLYQKCVGRF